MRTLFDMGSMWLKYLSLSALQVPGQDRVFAKIETHSNLSVSHLFAHPSNTVSATLFALPTAALSTLALNRWGFSRAKFCELRGGCCIHTREEDGGSLCAILRIERSENVGIVE